MSEAGSGREEGLSYEEEVSDLEAALLRIASLEWQVEPPPLAILEAVEAGFGAYAGLPPKVELLSDGRWARLLEAIAYTRPDGSEWPVPAGAELNGASIPRLFWSLIGGPFEGLYRDASIVHDHYCIVESRPWRDTHRMFYDAMRCSGVGKAKAKVMYYAVYRFGPRWRSPEGSALEAAASAGAVLTDAEAPSLAADAEAIYVQDLDLGEIDALADARNAAAGAGSLEGPEGAADGKRDRARRLVVTGGSGRAEDLEAVANEAALLPAFVMKRFEKKKMRIIACRESVTDFERDLRGVTPRGWEATGKTWDDVPGAYFPGRKRVVIATIGGVGAGRAVPTRESFKHGSENLIVHESLHGFDWIDDHSVLRDSRFVLARTGDMAALGAYEKQDGTPGLEETFAESGARFVANPAGLQQHWPNLHAYWAAGPHGAAEMAAEPTEAPEAAAAADGQAIGTADFAADGSIVLDLRAEDESGAIGHALLTIAPGDPAHAGLRAHIAGDSGEEATAGGPVLFRPMAASGTGG